MIRAAAAALLLAAPAAAQEPVWDAGATSDCLSRAATRAAQEACIGLSAEICMSGPAGTSTVGMGFCLSEELDWWDARLNAAYGELRAAEKAEDAAMASASFTPPSRADALRAMQRAWIPFRDARCDYERSFWGGGTGGGPATLSCLLHLTAEQDLYLRARLDDPQ